MSNLLKILVFFQFHEMEEIQIDEFNKYHAYDSNSGLLV